MQLFVLSLLLTAVAGTYLRVYDLLDDGAVVEHTWMEIGYAQLNDQSWTTIETTENELNLNNDKTITVFLSLPDYGGPTHIDGWPMVPKMKGIATKTSRGTYTFDAILVQPNDSYCPKIWWTPFPSGDVSVGWMAVEEGVYNVSETMFIIDSGEITRDNSVFIKEDTPSLYHAKSVHNYTTGCDSSDLDAVCTYKDGQESEPWLHLGSIQQLQTSVNKGPDGPDQELYLSLRARHVFTDRIVLMLMTHSVFQNRTAINQPFIDINLPYNQNFSFPLYPEYERILTPEIAGYFIWEKDLRLKCVEGLVMETDIRYLEVTNTAINVPYYFKYSIVPALFGMLGSLVSVADSTVLRVFNRTLNDANFITQEDQCTDEEQKHTTPESAFSMIIGDSPEYFVGQPQETQCFIVYDKQPCDYDILLVDTFGDGWGNNYFEVEILGEKTRYEVPCGSTSIHFSTTSCEFKAQMKCDGACTTVWENYWEFSFRGMDYYGDHDSTLHVKDHAVTVTDPVNVDPKARVNSCDQCKIAPPPPPPGTAAKNDAAAEDAAAAMPTAMLIGPNVVVQDNFVAASPAASGGAGTVMVYIVGTGVFFQLSAGGTASVITGISFKAGVAGMNTESSAIYDFSIPADGMATIEMMDGSFIVSESVRDMFLSGAVYCEVYTAEFPLGELRGQVVAMAVGTTFNLAPENEVPAVSSTGSGMIEMYRVMDGDNIGAILYSLTINSAESAVTAMHVHAGVAGANGAVFHTFTGTPISAFPAQLTGIISDEVGLANFALNMNAMYVNVHTTNIPSGELRGQIDFSEYDALMASDADSADADTDTDAEKPKPNVPVVIELFEEAVSVNGWYDPSGIIDAVADVGGSGRRLSISPMSFPVPRVLTYPKYTIANAQNTKLIHSGSICKLAGHRAAFERCEEKLPRHGHFIFRATGWVPENNQDTWKFCGVTGSVGQELQFEMKKGKCVPGSLIDAADLCAEGGSMVFIIGQVEFKGVILSELSHYDTLIFENEIAEMMGSVVSVSVNSFTQTDSGLLVTFGVTVAAERYNVDATVVDNIAPLVSTLQNSLSHQLVNNLFMTSAAKVQAAGYPKSSLLDATHASLVSFDYVGVKYASPLPADKVVSYPEYNQEPSAMEQESSSASFSLVNVASVCGVATIFIAFVVMKVRGNGAASASFDPLPTASEHVVDEKTILGMEL